MAQKIGGGAVEGEGDFEALIAESFDPDDAAGFGLKRVGIGESDDVAGGHRRDGKLNRAAVGVDDAGFAFDDPFTLQKMEARDNANLEKNALAAAAIADGRAAEIGCIILHAVSHLLNPSRSASARYIVPGQLTPETNVSYGDKYI